MPEHNLIDIHAHLLNDDYVAAMRAAGMTSVDGFPTPQWNPDAHLALMDNSGIKTSMLSISAPGIDFVPPPEQPGLARKVNEYEAKLAAQHPSRFGGLAILPLPNVDAALRELEYALDTLKLDGVVLFTNIGGIYLGDERFDSVFDELNRRKTSVFVHPVAPPGFNIDKLGFPAPTIEFPFDTTRMIMSMITSGTVRRCPDVRMIVAHGGGTLPFLAPRIARHLSRFSKARPAFTEDEVFASFRWFYYDLTGVSHTNAIDALLTLAPADKLVYGSDHPFMLSSLIPPAIDFVLSSPKIDDTTKRALSFGNAVKLFPRLAPYFK